MNFGLQHLARSRRCIYYPPSLLQKLRRPQYSIHYWDEKFKLLPWSSNALNLSVAADDNFNSVATVNNLSVVAVNNSSATAVHKLSATASNNFSATAANNLSSAAINFSSAANNLNSAATNFSSAATNLTTKASSLLHRSPTANLNFYLNQTWVQSSSWHDYLIRNAAPLIILAILTIFIGFTLLKLYNAPKRRKVYQYSLVYPEDEDTSTL